MSAEQSGVVILPNVAAAGRWLSEPTPFHRTVVSHEPRPGGIAVNHWVNPNQTITMRGRNGQVGVLLSEVLNSFIDDNLRPFMFGGYGIWQEPAPEPEPAGMTINLFAPTDLQHLEEARLQTAILHRIARAVGG